MMMFPTSQFYPRSNKSASTEQAALICVERKQQTKYEFVAFFDFRKEEKEDKLTTESLILAQDER